MNTNPYESPRLDNTKPRAARLEDRRRSPLEMPLLGLGAGLMIGGSAGAISAGSLAFVAQAVIQLKLDSNLAPVLGGLISSAVKGTIEGCIVGLVGGAVLGPIIGLAAIWIGSRWRVLLLLFSSLLCGLCGAVGGLLGGIEQEFHAKDLTSVFLGVGFGLTGGIVGGAILGRGLGILAWGSPSAEAKTSESESAELS